LYVKTKFCFKVKLSISTLKGRDFLKLHLNITKVVILPIIGKKDDEKWKKKAII